jgi:putative nucleotidyltransferase with HDIG domain
MRCPGQDSRFIKPQDVLEVKCGTCGGTVEFWPDELLRRCPGCGSRVSNKAFKMSCLEWCGHADECLKMIRSSREEALVPLREELHMNMKAIFGGDDARVSHAERVLELAEHIGREEGADPFIIVPAALLHDIGLAGVPRDADTPEARMHGRRGAEHAAAVLGRIGFPDSWTREVVEIIAHHHERALMNTVNARVLWDADLIVNLSLLSSKIALERLLNLALTNAGRRIGSERLQTPVAHEEGR